MFILSFCLVFLPFLFWRSPGIGALRRLFRHRPPSPSHRCHPLPPPCARRNTAKPAWVVPQLVRLKALMPNAGCRSIAHTFNRRYAHRRISVSKSYVACALRRHAYEIAILRRRIKHRVPTATPANRTWGLDLTGKQDAAGNVHAILGLIDHGSRRLLSLCLCPQRNALTLLGHVFLAMGKHGVPRTIRTDNDAVFKSRLFRWGLGLAGVLHRFSTPGCPWQNGRIERVFGTLKAELNTLAVDSGAALASLLDEFGVWYNHIRPHQHLGGMTPMEAWRGIDPYRQQAKSMRWVSFWDGRLVGYWLRR